MITGMDYWNELLEWTTGNGLQGNELLEWTTVHARNELVEWTIGMDYWNGPQCMHGMN